jgi:signal transduction histidine kinase/DNA-binding response OmpR family regulator
MSEATYFFSKKGGVMAQRATYRQLEQRIRELEGLLGEREKELNGLYGLSRIVEEHDISLDEMLQEVPSLLSASWKYPEVTCARIVVGGKVFATENFRVTEWRQASDIVAGGEKAGEIEVYYLEERPELDEGPFFKEERKLIDAFAKRLGRIIERKQLEEEIKRQWEQFAAIIDNFADSLYISDPQTYEVLLVNKSLEKALGKNPVGGLCYREFQGRSSPCEFCTSDIIQKDRKPYVWEHHNPLLGKDLLLTDQIIRWPDGRQVRYEIGIDITERKRMERELRQSQKMEALGTLAGGIAHDFNNILMPITLNTELALRSTGEPDKKSEYLSYVLEAAQRGRELVKQIITFSRRREQKREAVRIAPVIKEALQLLKASLPATITISENIDDVPSEAVVADPTQIHQVLMNLCTNAAHAMREGGGVLEVSLASVEVDQHAASSHADLTPGPYLRLTVSDTGEGMDRETMERIFEPFFTTKGRSEGTGMGLSVVHGIVKNHGGAITVYSEEGRGSTFKVFLPRALGGIERESLSPADVPTGKERILLVEDEEPVLRSERTMLESLGYKVIAFTKSDEALKLFRAEPHEFDLVITDHTMPIMTGSELSRKLLRIRGNVPIILCTGFSEALDEAKARAKGIREFVMKPFTTKEMAETIRRVLDE